MLDSFHRMFHMMRCANVLGALAFVKGCFEQLDIVQLSDIYYQMDELDLVLGICERLYRDNGLKAVHRGGECILTGDFRELLRNWEYQSEQAGLVVNMVKHLWKSNFIHRRYIFVLLYQYIKQFRHYDPEYILEVLKSEFLRIREILCENIIDLTPFSNEQIIQKITGKYDECIKQLIDSHLFSRIQSAQIRKIKS